MKEFNQFEKEIINRIIADYKKGTVPKLISILNPELENKDIYLDFEEETAIIKADINFYSDKTSVEEARKLIAKIVTTVHLLKYLQNEGYLILYNEAVVQGKFFYYGQLIQGNHSHKFPINDLDVKDLLIDYSRKIILVGQPLIEFVKNDFKTEEQIRANKESKTNSRNLSIALIALIVSVFLGVIGIFVGIYYGSQEVKYSKVQIEQEQNVKLNDNQLKGIENKIDTTTKSIKQINVKLDELNKK
jgi:hypothetical protein